MSDCAHPLSFDICPTQDELRPQILALLPRGRAWGEGGPAREPGGVIYGFFDAVAAVFAFLHAQICALALEFFCQTQSLTNDLWLEEYGLPDGCDPYPNLCAKVAALGGPQCAVYEEIGLQYGWSITCGMNCALDSGAMESGMAGGYTYAPATLIVVVDVANSPALGGQSVTMGPVSGFLEAGMTPCDVTYNLVGLAMGPVSGFLEAGMMPACGYDITSLDCVLQRIVHAHVQIVYAFVDAPNFDDNFDDSFG